MGTLGSPEPIRRRSGGIGIGVAGLGSRDLGRGKRLQAHGNWDVQIPLEEGDSEAGCKEGTQ